MAEDGVGAGAADDAGVVAAAAERDDGVKPHQTARRTPEQQARDLATVANDLRPHDY